MLSFGLAAVCFGRLLGSFSRFGGWFFWSLDGLDEFTPMLGGRWLFLAGLWSVSLCLDGFTPILGGRLLFFLGLEMLVAFGTVLPLSLECLLLYWGLLL